MTDPRFQRAMTSLGPSREQAARIQANVLRTASVRRSLAREWVVLVRARPVANSLSILAASAVLVLTTPMSAVLSFWSWRQTVTRPVQVSRCAPPQVSGNLPDFDLRVRSLPAPSARALAHEQGR